MHPDHPADGARRRFLAHGIGAGLGLGCGLMLPRTAAASTSPASVTLRVASYKGQTSYFFDDAGVADTPYKVDYAEFAGGNLIVEAIAGGSIDYGGMSEIPPIFAVDANTPLRIIGVLRGDVNNQVALVPKGSPITDPAQLKGKRVGYVRSTTSHYFLLRLLHDHGLDWRDIEPIALSPQDGLVAFQTGRLDAWVVYGLAVQVVQAQGARVLRTALGYLSGNYLVAAHARAIADPGRRAAIADYLLRERAGLEWINDNPQAWARKISRLTGAAEALFLEQFRQRSEPGRLIAVSDAAIRSQQQVADTFFEHGVLGRRLDVAPLWNRSFDAVLA
ncbi:ABC transporter substrate-binding protein [Thauera linaloolentis]|uniref:Nitrate/sulfonate/bicarbonate ABC transporter substrate binding protein family 3 n=1 Tax=Thauera linaloolentis (strain DSM 12138 / JCM 21573 / CCUG 41526 / CIP 105981 / IAM 15112 / NBRC 102519 / 47Lol) TaxID=1123367 RepID=N6Y5H5_THAL4|nr:ABC transporter substrate-binding protein [Thauera linaloolentis]ENO89431.1 nitrate/sulfonate/bicarbonate ABC transporter substrate binding protein family 3 [Thauera linaloolentis 47Lol = DSM 12138]MCM8566932.1 ABC transporter substrate-binding protein [Thauera linaloolentis]